MGAIFREFDPADTIEWYDDGRGSGVRGRLTLARVGDLTALSGTTAIGVVTDVDPNGTATIRLGGKPKPGGKPDKRLAQNKPRKGK